MHVHMFWHAQIYIYTRSHYLIFKHFGIHSYLTRVLLTVPQIALYSRFWSIALALHWVPSLNQLIWPEQFHRLLSIFVFLLFRMLYSACIADLDLYSTNRLWYSWDTSMATKPLQYMCSGGPKFQCITLLLIQFLSSCLKRYSGFL